MDLDHFRGDFTADQLREYAHSGVAMPDGSYPIPDRAYLEKAIHAVGRGNADHDVIRRHIIARAHALGAADLIPSDWNPDGSEKDRAEEPAPDLVVRSDGAFTRYVELDDISIRAGGDGRTVTAYAAVFDTPAEIRDQEGHYYETISPTAFNKTLKERAGNIQVFYNHGRTILGTPSERFSMPLGVPLEIKPDSRGLLTVTRYSKTNTADEVLELIRDGAIRGQSFSGRFVAGQSDRTRGGYAGIDAVRRNEVLLKEYGPTPMPAYKEAAMVGVRAEEVFEVLKVISPEERERLIEFLDTGRTVGTPSLDADAGAVDQTVTTAAVNADAGASQEATTVAEPVRDSGPSPSERRLRLLALKGLKS